MGRYTTVQSYTDNNPNMRIVSYEQATGGGTGATTNHNSTAAPAAAAPRPDKVFNPYGSTAGAGSSEFHVYRHARTREMVRLAQLEDEKTKQIEKEEYDKKIHDWNVEDIQRTEKNRKKRKRQKLAKQRKKNMKLAGVVLTTDKEDPQTSSSHNNNDPIDDDEFEYIPLAQQTEIERKSLENDEKVEAKLPFANDGSDRKSVV